MLTEEKAFGLLVWAMHEARKNKRYGKDWQDFEYRWPQELVRMMDTLMTREFRITSNYAFLVSYPKWREIFATIAQGRIADVLLCVTLDPYFEKELHPRTFNNRVGMGSQAAINQVIEDMCEVTEDYTRPARIMKWDLQAFFPNAQCDYMEQCFCRVIDKYAMDIAERFDADMPAFLKWLTMVVVQNNPGRHFERRSPECMWRWYIKPEKSIIGKPEGIGVPIGRLPSQKGMGLYINDEVRWWNDELGIRTTVFMDDGSQVVPEHLHQYALSQLPIFRERLEAKGIRLNNRKFYNQPWQHGLEFLGTHIYKDALILNEKTFLSALLRIREYNAITDKYQHIDNFISTVNSYTGLLKNRTSYNRIQVLKDTIADDWWQWLVWDDRRLCVTGKPEYSFCARLNRKYHLKLKTV